MPAALLNLHIVVIQWLILGLVWEGTGILQPDRDLVLQPVDQGFTASPKYYHSRFHP